MSAILRSHIRRSLLSYHAYELAGIFFLWLFSYIGFLFLQEISSKDMSAEVLASLTVVISFGFIISWLSADISKAFHARQREDRILGEVCQIMGVAKVELYILPERSNIFVFPDLFLRRICLGEQLYAILTDEELRSVFGHEVAHICLGHALWGSLLDGGFAAYNIIILFLYFTVFPDIIPTSISELLAFSPLGSLGEFLSMALVALTVGLGCSVFIVVQHNQETQADILGIHLHGDKPEQFISALEKLLQVCPKERIQGNHERIELLKRLFRPS